MLGANRLALEAWPLFPAFPAGDRIQTRGFSGVRANDTTWTWPLWGQPLTPDAVGAVLGLAALQAEEADLDALHRLGVHVVFHCQRILIGKTPNLTAAAALA
jgi:CRISPR-associated endonuclease/helicase Cas3